MQVPGVQNSPGQRLAPRQRSAKATVREGKRVVIRISSKNKRQKETVHPTGTIGVPELRLQDILLSVCLLIFRAN